MKCSYSKRTILFIGGCGLVGSNFQKTYNSKFKIISVDRDNIDILSEIDNKSINSIIYAVHPYDFKQFVFSKSIIDTQISLLNRVLVQFRSKNIDFILFSSGSVYLNKPVPITITNSINYKSNSQYVIGKVFSEMILGLYKDFYKSISIIRPFYIYGPNQNKDMIFSRIINSLKTDSIIYIDKGEGMKFNPIHVNDLNRYLEAVISMPLVGKNIFNFCGDEVITLKGLILLISKHLGLVPNIIENKRISENWVAIKNLDIRCLIRIDKGIKELL